MNKVRIITGILAITLCVSIVGCSNKNDNKSNDNKSSVKQEVKADSPVKPLNIDFDKMYPDEEVRNYAKQYIGKKAPDFTLKNLKGETVQLSSLKGQNVILEFASSSCSECKNTAVEFQSFEEKNKDIKILKLFPKDAKDDILAYFKQGNVKEDLTSISGKENLDKNTLVEDYNISFVPTLIFIDKNGFIPLIHVGGINEQNLTDMSKLCFSDNTNTELDKSDKTDSNNPNTNTSTNNN